MAHPDTVVIQQLQDALDDMPQDDPERGVAITNLGTAFRDRYRRTRSGGDLDSGIRMYHEAERLENFMSNQSNREVLFNSLGTAYKSKYKDTLALSDISLCIRYSEDALELAPVNHVPTAGLHARLRSAYFLRYNQTMEIADLDSSIEHGRIAVNASTEDDTQHEHRQAQLRFIESQASVQSPQDASEASSGVTNPRSMGSNDGSSSQPAFESLLNFVRENRSDEFAVLRHTGALWYFEYKRTGDLVDLDRAIQSLQKFIDSTCPNDTVQVETLEDLAHVLFQKFNATVDLDSLERAISFLQRAIDLTTNSDDQSQQLQNTAIMYKERFHATKDTKWLKVCMERLQSALNLMTKDDSVRQHLLLRALGSGHLTLYAIHGSLHDLEVSTQRIEETAAFAPITQADIFRLRNSPPRHARYAYGIVPYLPDVESAVLRAASAHGHVDVVQRLLLKGVDVNSADEDDLTPLFRAVANGHEQVIRLLAQHGADVNKSARQLGTALHVVSGSGGTDIARLLIQSGADVNAKGPARSPLHYASEKGRQDMVKLLIEEGADIHATDPDGHTALHKAAFMGHHVIAQLLLSHGSDVTQFDNQGHDPLLLAAVYQRANTVSCLLSNGANANASAKGASVLHWATTLRNYGIVRLLLEHGADANADDASRQKPLHKAAMRGLIDIMSLLLRRTVNASTRDSVGRTPLFYACLHGHLETVKLILYQDGVDVHMPDYYGSTPLSIAARHGFVQIVRLLIGLGVDVATEDSLHRSAIWWASREGHSEVALTILERGQQLGLRLLEANTLAPPALTEKRGRLICDICTLRSASAEGGRHCAICQAGDFDICTECLTLGAHCLDPKHTLRPHEP